MLEQGQLVEQNNLNNAQISNFVHQAKTIIRLKYTYFVSLSPVLSPLAPSFGTQSLHFYYYSRVRGPLSGKLLASV